MLRMRRNKSRLMLLGPLTFKVSMSGDSCIGVGIHVSKVGEDEVVDKGNSVQNKLRCRVQIGC